LILISQILKQISIGNFGNSSKVVRISPLVAACTLEAIVVTGRTSFFNAVEYYRGKFGKDYRIFEWLLDVSEDCLLPEASELREYQQRFGSPSALETFNFVILWLGSLLYFCDSEVG